jgi:hypothetical protein
MMVSIMKNTILSMFRYATGRGMILGFALLVCGSASAQVNLLKNGNFDTEPLGPTNWTVLYFHGGPDDWEIRDRTTPSAGYHNGSFYDAQFRPAAQKLAHACFTQTVTNLTLGHTYNISGMMREDWWKAPNDALRDKYLVYLEVIGGLGAANSEGRMSVLATSPGPTNEIDAPFTYPTYVWRTFTAQQTPDANRKIEVRLHYEMLGYVEWDKCWLMSGFFDAISLTY